MGTASSSLFNGEYLKKLVSGDAETELHFTNHFTGLLRIKLRKLRSPEMVEDVRQETFFRVLQMLRKEDRIHSPERLGAFVNSVCNNIILEGFRGKAKLQQMPEDYPEVVDESADPTLGLVADERRRVVARILAELAPKERDLLRMVYLEDREKDAICREIHVTPEYLRVLIHRAKAKFRAELEKAESPGR